MGIPEMIDSVVAEIGTPQDGFALYFSEVPFPGIQVTLDWVREDCGGNWYRRDGTDQEGWLCPALFKYFDRAPSHLYARAEAVRRAGEARTVSLPNRP
jgi:hypothetical protein